MTLLVVTVVWLMMNVGLTFILKPEIFQNVEFWALQVDMVHSLYNRHVFSSHLIRRSLVISWISWFNVSWCTTKKHMHQNIICKAVASTDRWFC